MAAIRSRTNVAKIEFRSDRSVATMVLTIKNDSMEILMYRCPFDFNRDSELSGAR